MHCESNQFRTKHQGVCDRNGNPFDYCDEHLSSPCRANEGNGICSASERKMVMHEMLKALQFYRILKLALNSTGIKEVKVIMTEDGELQADIMMPEPAN